MPTNPLQPTTSPFTANSIVQQVKALQLENKLLRAQLQLSQKLTNASIDCVLAMDTNLNITAWNNACELFSGMEHSYAIGRPFYEMFPDAKGNVAISNAIAHALEGKKSFLPADSNRYMQGHFESHIIPLLDDDGKVEGILQVMHDVAHRIKAEEKLAALNEELMHKYEELKGANAELATFTHITSHDLKEPLRKIYIFIEMVLNKDGTRLSNDGRANMRRVQSSVQHLSLLADSLVSFSEIKQEPHRQVSLNQALREAITLLKPRINDQQAVIHAADLPNIMGSEWQFRLLFQQLLSNSIKFHTSGAKPVVNITLTTPQGDGGQVGYVCIAVEDNGIGIDPQYHDKIFELFSRLHGKKDFPGVGMGLALVKKIADRHKGFVKVTPGREQGTRFECYFPIALIEGLTEETK